MGAHTEHATQVGTAGTEGPRASLKQERGGGLTPLPPLAAHWSKVLVGAKSRRKVLPSSDLR